MMIQPKNPSANIRAYLQESVVPMLLTGLAEEHESAVQGESDERDPEQPLEDRDDHRAGDEDDGDDGEDLPEAQATTGGCVQLR